jgi:hypothetical protein
VRAARIRLRSGFQQLQGAINGGQSALVLAEVGQRIAGRQQQRGARGRRLARVAFQMLHAAFQQFARTDFAAYGICRARTLEQLTKIQGSACARSRSAATRSSCRFRVSQ